MATGTCGFQHTHKETEKENEWCGHRLRNTVLPARFDPTDRNKSPQGTLTVTPQTPSRNLRLLSKVILSGLSLCFCLWSDKLTGISSLPSSSINANDQACSASLSPVLCVCRLENYNRGNQNVLYQGTACVCFLSLVKIPDKFQTWTWQVSLQVAEFWNKEHA